NIDKNISEEMVEKFNPKIVELLEFLNTELVKSINDNEIFSNYIFRGKKTNKTGKDFYEFQKRDSISKYEIYFGTYKLLKEHITVHDPDRKKNESTDEPIR